MKVPRSCCVENCSNNARSQPNLNFYILPSDKQRRWRWVQAIGRVQQRLMFLHSSLVDQLYVKEVYFCSFVTKSNQASIKYSPKCISEFLSYCHTWESHGFFTRRFPQGSNGISPHFTFFRFEPPNKNPPKQVNVISTAHQSSSIPRNKSKRHMNPVVNN